MSSRMGGASPLRLSFGYVIAVLADGVWQAEYFLLHGLFTDEPS